MSVESSSKSFIFVNQGTASAEHVSNLRAVPVQELQRIEKNSQKKGSEYFTAENESVLGDPTSSEDAWNQVAGALHSEPKSTAPTAVSRFIALISKII